MSASQLVCPPLPAAKAATAVDMQSITQLSMEVGAGGRGLACL